MAKRRLLDSCCIFKSSQLVGNVSFYYRAREKQEISEKDGEGVLSFMCSDGQHRLCSLAQLASHPPDCAEVIKPAMPPRLIYQSLI